jgi:hypothetical protein
MTKHMSSRQRGGCAINQTMPKRLAALVCLVLLGLALGGCSRCGWVWDDGPRACRADAPRSVF